MKMRLICISHAHAFATYFTVLILLLSSSIITWYHKFDYFTARAANESRFRFGASVPSNSFYQFSGGGAAFYNYMTRGPGFFAHIDWAMGLATNIWAWSGEVKFLNEMLDAADADEGRCEISITLYGADLGWPEFWKPKLQALLEKIGPNRPSLRFIFLAGEWSYRNKMPPSFDELKKDFFEAKELVESYGYRLGWQGEGKYFSRIPKELWNEVLSWGYRCRNAQISYDPDPIKGAAETYDSANGWRHPNDVFLNAFTMWDNPANMPGTPPYYVYYEKFEAYFRAASELYDSTGGQYPQSLTFDVMPITFDKSKCPYLDWWAELCEKYNVRTSRTPPVQIKEPTNLQPPSPFPPYPTVIHFEPDSSNLMPFYVQAGGKFKGHVYAKNVLNDKPLAGKEVEIYLVKQTLRPDSYWRPDHPITRDEWENNKIYVGKVTLGRDGWAYNLEFPAPTEPGRYALMPRVPSSASELEGWPDTDESILVGEKTHVVEVKSNIRIRVAFGPTGYGPPWQGVDSQRWVSPTELLKGTVSEGSWTFIAPKNLTAPDSTLWVFSHWEDGSPNPTRTIFVDRDLVLEAHYLEQGVKSKLNIYGYVRDDRNYSLAGASVTVSSLIDRVFTTTDLQGKYAVTLSVNGLGDTISVAATYQGRSGSASTTVSNEDSSMQINVTVLRTSTSIFCSARPLTVRINGSVSVSGGISPAVGEAIVTLTYTKPDASSFVRIVTTSSNGAYSDNYIPDQLGSYSVIASWPGNADYEGATSTPASFMVRKNPSFISINLDATSIVPGSTLRISGALSPTLSNVKIVLSYRVKGGSWVVLRTVLTDSNGRFSYVWTNTPSVEGEYELSASWSGNDYYEDSSCSISFIVLEVVNPPPEPDSSFTIEEPSLPVTHEPMQNTTVILSAPNFTVSANPKVVKVPRISGYNTTVTIKVSSLSNYTMVPSLKVSKTPERIEAQLSHETLRIQSFDSNFTCLVIRTDANPPEQGNYTIQVECSYEGVVRKELVTLFIVDRASVFLKANITPPSIQYGNNILINGSVSPPHQARITVKAIIKNGTEINIATFNTDGVGAFSQSIGILLVPDDYIVRVLCEEDVFYLESVLNLTLRVEKASLIITLSSNSTGASSEEPVFLNGIVTTAEGKPVQDINVTITVSGGTGTTWIYAKTNNNGKYEAVIDGLSPGKYDVISVISDGDYYEPARSIPIKLEIQHPASQAMNNMLYLIISLALIILVLITSIRVLVSTVHEIRAEQTYRANRFRDKK